MKSYTPDRYPVRFGEACEEMWKKAVSEMETYRMEWKGCDYEVEVVIKPRNTVPKGGG